MGLSDLFLRYCCLLHVFMDTDFIIGLPMLYLAICFLRVLIFYTVQIPKRQEYHNCSGTL